MLNALAINAIEAGNEQITDDAVLQWSPVVKPEATYTCPVQRTISSGRFLSC
jgi:hypothetical protein